MSFNTDALMKALKADIGSTKQPTDDSSVQHWAAYSLQANLIRKFTDSNITKNAEIAALEKFEGVNKRVGLWTAPVESTAEAQVLIRAAKLLKQQFLTSEGSPKTTLAKAFNVGMVGPGAAIDAVEDNFIDKLFNSKLTCTHPILFKFYKQAIAEHKPWRKAEHVRSRMHGEYTVVKGNNLFYVPKETVIARTAATEPTLNMFGQIGYGNLIEDILSSSHNIVIKEQQNINKWFARSSSSTGEYATIDLSSASDTIGLKLLSHILPANVLKDLIYLRSPHTKVPGRSKTMELNMISTMGNGFTFPLQTLIFANLVLATMLHHNEPIYDIYGKRRYSVYGDDIICPTKVYNQVTAVLHAAGFTVNLRKSFASGKFRESCGGDYFNGSNIRSVYLKEYTNGCHGYSLINRLIDWSGRHNIPLPNTIRYLRSLVQFRPIPQYEDETTGIRVPLSRLTGRKTDRHGNYIYHAVKRNVYKITPTASSVKLYYHAFHVALLHGSFKHGKIEPRVKPGCESYKVVKCTAPIHWDFSPDSQLTTEERCNAFDLNWPIRLV